MLGIPSRIKIVIFVTENDFRWECRIPESEWETFIDTDDIEEIKVAVEERSGTVPLGRGAKRKEGHSERAESRDGLVDDSEFSDSSDSISSTPAGGTSGSDYCASDPRDDGVQESVSRRPIPTRSAAKKEKTMLVTGKTVMMPRSYLRPKNKGVTSR